MLIIKNNLIAQNPTTDIWRKTRAKRVNSRQVNDLESEIVARLSALTRQDTQSIRKLRREFSRQLTNSPAELILKLATRLIRRSEFIPRFIAYELVQHHNETMQRLGAKSLNELGKGINNWAAVDTFACYLAGPAWREGQITDSVIRRWARSKNRWWRRAALVSTVALNNQARGGVGDTARTLMVCGLLAGDHDDMVVKALSWALRELSKRDSGSVSKFLREHKEVVAPRVAREVNNKLKTGLKNPR